MDTECQTVSVEDAGKILGYSRNTAYEAVRNGQLTVIRIGRKIRVPKMALERILAGSAQLMAEANPAELGGSQ
jgi:excisionase family DNA binding protein